MTPIADMVERLIAAGCAPAVAAVVVMEAFEYGCDLSHDVTRTVTTGRTDDQRERDRLRKQKSRRAKELNPNMAKANDVAVSQDLSADGHSDKADDRCDLSSFLSSSSVEPSEEKKKEVVARARGTRLPPDWKPDDRLRAWCRSQHGMTDQEIDEFNAEFHDFWSGVPGARGCKSNWPGTFRNRVRDTIQKIKARRNNGQSKSVIAAADRQRAKLAEFERGDEPDLLAGVRDGSGALDVRLLPSR